jgi:hypothetical protein
MSAFRPPIRGDGTIVYTAYNRPDSAVFGRFSTLLIPYFVRYRIGKCSVAPYLFLGTVVLLMVVIYKV